MNDNTQKLDAIILKINILMEKYIELEEKHIEVLEENQELKKHSKKQKEELLSLNNKIKDLNLADNINSSGQETATLKVRIDEFVKEIDKCMAMLNN